MMDHQLVVLNLVSVALFLLGFALYARAPRYLKASHRSVAWLRALPPDHQRALEALAPHLGELLETLSTLPTQDNRLTAHPIFQVRVEERVYGIDPDRVDDEHLIFYDGDNCERVTDPDEVARLMGLYQEGEDLPEGIEAVGFTTVEQVVMSAFTEEGCKRYLKRNGHNLRHYHGEPWIYADSLFRCHEMIVVRNALIAAVRAAQEQP